MKGDREGCDRPWWARDGPQQKSRRSRNSALPDVGPGLLASVLAAARALRARNVRVGGRTAARLPGEGGRPRPSSQPLRDHPRERAQPEPRVGQREFCESARGTVRSMPGELRVPFLLRAERDLSYREIAQHLGIGVEAVGLRVLLAREQVRSGAGDPARPGTGSGRPLRQRREPQRILQGAIPGDGTPQQRAFRFP